jgi:hypothetical protein
MDSLLQGQFGKNCIICKRAYYTIINKYFFSKFYQKILILEMISWLSFHSQSIAAVIIFITFAVMRFNIFLVGILHLILTDNSLLDSLEN